MEVRRFGYYSVGIRVVLAAQPECLAYLIVLSKGMDDPAPQGHLGQHLHVSDAVHPLLGARQGHADAVGYLEKTHLAFLIAPYEREEDDVILFPLVFVHHMDLDTSKCLSWHEFAQAEQLPSVGGEDGDLGGQVLLAQEVLAQLYHKMSLMLILVAFAFLDFLFRKVVFYKVKVGRDPLKKKITSKLESSPMAAFPFYLHIR